MGEGHFTGRGNKRYILLNAGLRVYGHVRVKTWEKGKLDSLLSHIHISRKQISMKRVKSRFWRTQRLKCKLRVVRLQVCGPKDMWVCDLLYSRITSKNYQVLENLKEGTIDQV
jgi:hypothetical protein